MLDRTRVLVDLMREQSPTDLQKMMSISPELADLNAERFRAWSPQFTPSNSRAAVLAFSGDTYRGLAAPTSFDERDFTRAQKTLRILSGLHGVLRPLDLIQPYRLEMGSTVRHATGDDLYGFWGDAVTKRLNADIVASPGARVLINLASREYFTVVNREELDARVISPVFLDAKGDGDYRVVSFFAKRARGAMARWLVQKRIGAIKTLREFDLDGYAYDPDRSTAEQPVFVRRAA